MPVFRSGDTPVASSHDSETIVERDESIEQLWSEMALVREVDFNGIVGRVFGAGATPAMKASFKQNGSIDSASREWTLEAFRRFNAWGSFRNQAGKLAAVCLLGALIICGLLASALWSASVSADKITA